MANLKIENVSIKGISACVPSHVEENISLSVFKNGEAERVIAQTGIDRKHKVEGFGITASDLCEQAFEKLIEELNWSRESIDILAFTTLTPDYLEPPTGCVLHGKLGLPESCFTIDLTQGCPGWINALATVSSMLSHGHMKRAILLNGDTATLMRSTCDKESLPLFGDAGTATALEYEDGAFGFEFDLGTRGKDYKSIIRPAGGFRKPITIDSLEYKEYGENILRREIDAVMDGMSVFAFGISTGPKSVLNLCEKYNICLDKIDLFVMHQANQYLNEKIRKKLKIPSEKTPYSLKDYGNTSGASIPVTIVTQCCERFEEERLDSIACAFGVGLAWGSAHFKTNHIVCPKVIYYE